MKRLLFFFVLLLPFWASGQETTISFESYNLPLDTFLNGSDLSGGFEDQSGFFLPNDYNPMWSSWSGWSISTMTDTITRGFMNQYSCISGQGHDGTETYATAYAPDPIRMTFRKRWGNVNFKGLHINNSAYAYHSMAEGDAIAKRFGGVNGTDPDFLKLTIYAYLDDELKEDSIEFYLADFRSDNESEDYIIKDWTYLDLSPLGNVDSLEFSLTSSDVGRFGMNTPAYFCVDNISFEQTLSKTSDNTILPLKAYPNPVTATLTVSEKGLLQILDELGRVILTKKVSSRETIDVSRLHCGTYQVILAQDDRILSTKLIKI